MVKVHVAHGSASGPLAQASSPSCRSSTRPASQRASNWNSHLFRGKIHIDIYIYILYYIILYYIIYSYINTCKYKYIILYYIYTYIHMSSRRNPLHLSSCYCCGCRFWGGPYRFPGFCGNQHVRDPTWSQNPFLNRLGNGSRSCFVGFRCFGNTSCSFNFALICMHLPSCPFHLHAFSSHFAFISFHFPFMFLSFIIINFLSCSFHFHSNVYSLPFIFLPFASMFLSFLHSCPFMSFLKLWKWLYSLACNKWFSLSYR